MRIGLISFHSFWKPGGVKRHVLSLHEEFKKRGIYSKVIVPRRFLREDYGKDVILLGTSFPLLINGTEGDFDVNFNPLAIQRVLEREKFDILHFHNFGFPSVLQILERSRALNVLTFHANIEKSKLLERFPFLLSSLKKIVQWKMDGVIGVSSLNLKVFEEFTGPKRIIPNGVDLKKFNPKAPPIKKFSDLARKFPTSNGTGRKINILFVGRIEKRKGLIYLIKAYEFLSKKFPNLRLIIVGDGPLKKKCQKWVSDHNTKEVYFEGRVGEEEIASYFASSDIFCAPSIFGESFGMVLLEAMASAKPVTGFANLGYKTLLKGKGGEDFLAKPKDYRALARKIEILIGDKDLREKLGKQGRKEAQRYSWSKIASEVLDFYKLCQREKKRK